jgi:hypothetical protein
LTGTLFGGAIAIAMRQVDAATSPTIPRTHLPLPVALLAQMQANHAALATSNNPPFSLQSNVGPTLNVNQQLDNSTSTSLPLPAYLQLCSLPSNRKTQRVQSSLDTNHNHQSHAQQTYQTLQATRPELDSRSLHHKPANHASLSLPSTSGAFTSGCRVCLAIRLNSGQCAPTGAFIPSSYLNSSGLSHPITCSPPTVTVAHSESQERALSAAPVLQVNERSLSLTGSSGVRSQGPSPLPNCSSSLQRSQSARRTSGRSPLTVSPPTHSIAYASSVGDDSQVESPTAAYLDNNDSVNIFAKYQTASSSAALSSAPFANHFLHSPKDHGCFRRSVPTMPLLVAIVLCIVNWFLPGAGNHVFPFRLSCFVLTRPG